MSEPPAKMRLVAFPLEDGEHVQLRLDMNDEPLGHILFDGATAERHALEVGKARSALTDPVSPTLDPGSRLEVTPDPAWRLELSKYGPTLALRHPGLGWLGFVLPPHEAKHMGEALLALAQASAPGPAAG